MRLSGFWSGLDWGGWTYGLIKGAISGGATSVYAAFGTALIDKNDFALGSAKSFQLIGLVFAFSAAMQTFAYLSKTPLPDTKKREESFATITQPGKPTVTVATVKETSVVPIDPPKGEA